MTRIAVVDDEKRLADILTMLLSREGYEVEAFYDAENLFDRLGAETWDVVITDLKMPNVSGVEVVRQVKTNHPSTEVVVITAHATVETAVEAMRLGAFDYIQKPFDNQAIKTTVANALKVSKLRRENAYLRSEIQQSYGERGVIAKSDKMREALSLAQRVASSDSTVLIFGDSGTGKEVVAKTVHFFSDRVDRPFVPVNCKSLSASLLESETFWSRRRCVYRCVESPDRLVRKGRGRNDFPR